MTKSIVDFDHFKQDNWNKVYRSARDLMPLLWYKKWERFYWVIGKAIKKNTKKGINTNTIFVLKEPESTWGRPRIDFELSKYACYLISLEADIKKKEVEFARIFFEHELRSDNKKYEKIKNENKAIIEDTKKKLQEESKNIEMRFFTQRSAFDKIKSLFWFLFKLVLIVILLSILLKILLNTSIEREWLDNISNFKLKDVDFLEIEESKEDFIEINKITNELTLEERINDYIDNYSNFSYSRNTNRNEFTNWLKWAHLVKSFFLLWNNWFIKDSCSLLNIYKCNPLSNLSSFWNFWDKTVDWYFIDYVYEVSKTDEWTIYCVKSNYKLKDDLNPNRIEETYHYITNINSKWVEEIVSRVCESIKKWERNISCWYNTSVKYCD